jgi:hypothetical protein
MHAAAENRDSIWLATRAITPSMSALLGVPFDLGPRAVLKSSQGGHHPEFPNRFGTFFTCFVRFGEIVAGTVGA